MGVYIKDMEMPSTGLYFVSVDNTGGRDKTVMTVERMLGNRDVRQIVGSFELVPVPTHGRCIDVDKLNSSETDYLGNHFVYLVDIDDAPTVIPAEEDK